MKSPIFPSLAALVVAGAVPFAHSQANAPAPTAIEPSLTAAAEPVASVSRPDAVADAIAQALNGDASMKRSKITVQPEAGGILLTGVTPTEAQRLQASKVAATHAGEGNVVNIIATEEVVIHVPSPAAG